MKQGWYCEIQQVIKNDKTLVTELSHRRVKKYIIAGVLDSKVLRLTTIRFFWFIMELEEMVPRLKRKSIKKY